MKTKRIKRALFILASALCVTAFAGCHEVIDAVGHQHVFDCKDTNLNFLKSEADCENGAVYYYSCSCGEKGTETFSYGKAADHTYAVEWSSDKDAHWHAADCGHDLKADVSTHDWNEGEITLQPTEEADGEKTYKCVVCGTEKTETIPALIHEHTFADEWTSDEYVHWYAADCGHEVKGSLTVHSWDDGEVLSVPTEETAGETKYTCVICGYEKIKTLSALIHEHTYDADWSSDAYVHWYASNCGHDIKVSLAVHTWDDGEIITLPTETSEGETCYTCVLCGYEKKEVVPMLTHEHTYDNEWTSNEYIHWHAADCGHDVQKDVSTHIWGDKIVSVPATEDSTGLYTYECVLCGKEKTEVIPMFIHTHSFENGWTYDGDTHWHAADCGHDIKSDVAVHVWDAGTIIVEPTEDTEGEIVYKCLICKMQTTQEIPVLGHEHTYENAWVYDGYIHWRQANCGHDEKIDVAAHIWGESVVTVPATEDNTGVLTYTCVICTAEKTEIIPQLTHYHTYAEAWTANELSHWRAATCSHTGEVANIANHHWNNGVTTISPTENNVGEITYTCIVCEYRKTEVLPVLNHTHSFTLKTTDYLHSAADCTHKATYYYSCACGEKGEALFEQGNVAAHKFINYFADGNATCSMDGTKTAKCENCDLTNTISDLGSKLPHAYATEWTTDEHYHWHVATCEHSDAMSSFGSHSWDAGVETLAPTEESEGVRTYTCEDCARTRTESIPKQEHIHKFTQMTNEYLASKATCQNKATYYYTCVCGEKGTETYEYGAYAAHNFVDYVYDGNATCSADGTKTAVCATDGCNVIDRVTAVGTKLPHTFSADWNYDAVYHWHYAICGHSQEISGKEEHQWNSGVVTKNPTETEEGTKLFTCVICENTKTESIPKLEHVHNFTQKTNEYLASEATCQHKATYYYTCACGERGTETYEYGSLASHTYNDYVSNNDATCGNDGTKTRICSVCGHEDTVVDVGTKLPHTYESEWSYDADSHWYAATCEHTNERKDEAAHAWDEGVVTIQPTEETDGERLHTCTVCDTTKTEAIPHLDHVHTFAEEWSYNETKHWKAATCNHANEKGNEEAHDFVLDVEHSAEPTVYEKGVNVYVCSVCEYVKEEDVAKLASFTVIFYDARYNVLSEKNYAIGTSEISIPTAPAKAGYSFIEWVSAADETEISSIVFANAQDNDIYLFNPVYLKQYTVTFVDYNGNTLDTITVLDGEYIDTADLPAIPERTGYTAVWDSAVTSSMVTENMTVTPVYNVVTYEVTFIDKDGKPLAYVNENGESVTLQIVPYGSFAIVPEYPQYWFDQTTLKLYEFTGWSVDVDHITSNHIGANAVKALYEKEVEQPVIAIKISGATAKVSITMPSNAELYSIKLSAKWSNDNGLCGITQAQFETISSLNKDACGETLCTVGDKNGESGWLTYNNKNNTFDFMWNCGNGHSMGAENVFTLTFESPSPSFVLDESLFEILATSSIVYGDVNGDITNLEKAEVFVWFYE